MKHTRAISTKPARAQSAYASKLEFKQSASTQLTTLSALLADGLTLIPMSYFINALGLNYFVSWTIGTTT